MIKRGERNRKKSRNPLPLERISFCKRYRDKRVGYMELRRGWGWGNLVLESEKSGNYIGKYNLYR